MTKWMIELAACVVIAAMAAWAIVRIVKKAKHGGGCCGEREADVKKVKVADKNKTHYPYSAALRIEGMTCENCARRVENSLNSLDGIWARVDLSHHTARVRMKNPVENKALIKAVTDAGYAVTEVY